MAAAWWWGVNAAKSDGSDRYTTEYFNRAPGNLDGLNGQCRDCRLAWARAYRAANREKIRQQNRAGQERSLDTGDEVCVIEGCDRPVYRRPQPYCGSHYARLRKYGDPSRPLQPPGPRAEDITGQRFGMLTVLSQDGQRCVVRCDCGVEKDVACFNLRWDNIKSCGNHKRGAEVTYGGIHQRVRVDRGLASRHPCVDCDGPAMDWSYDHQDLDELISDEGLPYSAHVDHYEPRCRPCHRKFDAPYVSQREKGSHELQLRSHDRRG